MSNDADLVLTGGRITTIGADAGHPEEVTALAIRQGRVLAIGSDDEVRAAAPGAREVRLDGQRVIPGLIDSHMHFVRAGRTWNDEVRWEDVYDLDDALASLRRRAAEVPAGRWIRVIGGWDQRQFRQGRGPTRAELDGVAPDHPVYVQMQYTSVTLNTLAMTELGVDEDLVSSSPLPEGFERDSDGRLTGHAVGDPLMSWFYRLLPIPTEEEQVASTAALSRDLARVGITGVIDGGGLNTGPEAYTAIHEAWRRGELKTRVRLFKHATRQGTEAEDYAGYMRFNTPRFGDDVLRFSGIGEVLMYRTHDRIARPADYGPEAMAETRDVLMECARRGWTVQIHVHQRDFFLKLLDVFEEIDRVHPIRDLRWGFVHAERTYAEDTPRLRALGVGLLFQSLLRLNGESAVEAWGADVVAMSPQMRELWDAGLPIGLGSDAMRVASYNPFTSLEYFLTGRTVQGNVVVDERHLLDRAEALRGYTNGGAWFTFEEDVRGRLVPGAHADLAVLTDDYFTVPVDQIHKITSRLTLLGGEVVWDDGSLDVPS